MKNENHLKKRTFFGLTYPQDFPLQEDVCCFLSRFFLMDEFLTPKEIQKFLDDTNKGTAKKEIMVAIKDINKYIKTSSQKPTKENYGCMASSIYQSVIEFYCCSSDTPYERFKDKLFAWIKEYSFPERKELYWISRWTSIPKETIYEGVYNFLFKPEMPASKITDFIAVYKNFISPTQIDELLNLYSLKTGPLKEFAFINLN